MNQDTSTPVTDTSISERLRAIEVFAVDLPEFDPGAAPADPVSLFVDWLREAIDDGVREPHAMVLCTVGEEHRPSSRVLILKDVDADGRWYFASGSTSRKGRELAANPHAAITFHWPAHGRQIRIRGTVESAGRERSAADFLGRSAGARAESLLGRQSQALAALADVEPAVRESAARLLAEPNLVAENWTLYALTAHDVEFWQADKQRRHTRLTYGRDLQGDQGGQGGQGGPETQAWTRSLLWP